MIWEKLDESRIYLGLKAKNTTEIFEKMGQPLIKMKLVKENYIEGLIEREKEFPTGLGTAIGVAIPHTSADYVNKTTFSVAVLDKPVQFVEMGTDDDKVNVEVVIMLTIAEQHGHIDMLQKVIAIIQDSELVKNIKYAKDEKSVIELIKQKEEKL